MKRESAWRMIALACAMLSTAGCQQFEPKGMSSSPPGAGAPSSAESGNPFAPVQMRIHPLTRWGPVEGGRRTIEAHVELFDRWSDSVKGIGVMRFELTLAGAGGIGTIGARREEADERTISRWEIDLTDPDRNSKQFFDHVTRTYIFALAVDSGVDANRRLRLRAAFTLEGGQTLRADFDLEPS